MMCNVINSPYGHSSIAFGAITAVAASAFVIFQVVAPNAFASCGGIVLYALPGVTCFASFSSFITAIIREQSSKVPVIEEIQKESKKSQNAQRVSFIIESYGQWKKNNDGEAGLELHASIEIIATAFQNSKDQCKDVTSTAKALEIQENALRELFQCFGFPEMSWNTPGCLNAFFVYCQCLINSEGRVVDLEQQSAEKYWGSSHPLWPGNKAPCENDLTIGEFAQFLFIDCEELIGLLKGQTPRIGFEKLNTKTLNKDSIITSDDMGLFCATFSMPKFDKQLREKQTMPDIWKIEKQFQSIWTDEEALALSLNEEELDEEEKEIENPKPKAIVQSIEDNLKQFIALLNDNQGDVEKISQMHEFGKQLHENFKMLALQFQEAKKEGKCVNLPSTARALNMNIVDLQVLFKRCEFPEASWEDPGCLNAFFVNLPKLITCKGSFNAKRSRGVRNQFFLGHFLWPEDKIPNKNPLTVAEFAQFLFISLEDLLLLAIEAKIFDEQNDKLTIETMRKFCEYYDERKSLQDLQYTSPLLGFDDIKWPGWTKERQLALSCQEYD